MRLWRGDGPEASRLKTAVALLLLVALAAVVVALVAFGILRAVRRWRAARAPWELEEDPHGGAVFVYAKRGDQTLLVGEAPFAAIDFDGQLWELRARGREQVYVLNQRERPRLLGRKSP